MCFSLKFFNYATNSVILGGVVSNERITTIILDALLIEKYETVKIQPI